MIFLCVKWETLVLTAVWKLSKLDEPDMQDAAGEAGMSS